MVIVYIVFLAIVQGVTEFLPISSSAHLILGRDLMNALGVAEWTASPADELAFDVALHIGSLGAVVVYFWRDVVDMAHGALDGIRGRFGERFHFLLLLVIATIPIMVVGLLAKDLVTELLRSTQIIAWTTILFGILLWVADRQVVTVTSAHRLLVRDAVIVGLLQCLALIPGVSRSGICMTTGRALGMDRPLSARFATLLSLPTILGAGLLATLDLYRSGDTRLTVEAILGGLVAFVAAYVAIKLMMSWLRRADYLPFVMYRIALGLLLLVLIYGFGWQPAA
ncbi:undecaprenyl-diphosphate phosphatase [Lutibaculum baratangense]|uniref:Undecaprenyl-diphosphatase n=1 Tax=Lutibaculum baratangense AMV1 TaxID=631454 RepID=V4R2F0_9HYPH|nr:undecaprenyl-diphosphate phosphatase [Lutibaculum baratangense]ESR26132.1 Undecaprenyl-diphosphatase [Lutibaculum baratangense AMV1]